MRHRMEIGSFQECSCYGKNIERNKKILGAMREEVLRKVDFSWFLSQFALFKIEVIVLGCLGITKVSLATSYWTMIWSRIFTGDNLIAR